MGNWMSSLVSIIIFSLAFFFIPMKIKVRNKLILITTTILCYALGKIAWLLFTWWVAIFIIVLFLFSVTILIGGKINWLEQGGKVDMDSPDKDLPNPMYSYGQLLERSANAVNLDITDNISIKPSFNKVQDVGQASVREVAVTMEDLSNVDEQEILSESILTDGGIYDNLITSTQELPASEDIISKYSSLVNTVDTNEDDIQQIFKSRQILLDESENLDNSNLVIKQDLNTHEPSDYLEHNSVEIIKDSSNDDLQLLYERIREDKERG